MSNHWDMHCKDCNESAGFYWNHGDKQLKSLDIHILASLARSVQWVAERTSIDLIIGHGDNNPDISFFIVHENHNVSIKSEYGYYIDDKENER